MHNSGGFEFHQARTGCVGSNRVIRNNNLPKRTSTAVKGPVAFPGYDAVCDHEVYWNCSAQIEIALLNAFPVEKILRPLVSRSRNYAEHVVERPEHDQQ